MNRDDTTRRTGMMRRLVGVYNANGTFGGELAYFVGARFGRTHCALCDITHGLARQRPQWKTCRANLAVPFNMYHLNDQPDTVRAAYDGVAPVVLAETDTDLFVLLGPDELRACQGSVEHFAHAVSAAVAARGLSWPS